MLWGNGDGGEGFAAALAGSGRESGDGAPCGAGLAGVEGVQDALVAGGEQAGQPQCERGHARQAAAAGGSDDAQPQAGAGADARQAWLERFAAVPDVAFAFEACTGWRYLAEELAAAGVRAHLAEPADTAAARGRKRRAKTDRADARLIQDLLLQGRLPGCWIPPGQVLECRALLETYHALRREHTGWVQRAHAVLYHQGAPRLGEGGTGTAGGRELLRRIAAGSCRRPGGSRSACTCGCWR